MKNIAYPIAASLLIGCGCGRKGAAMKQLGLVGAVLMLSSVAFADSDSIPYYERQDREFRQEMQQQQQLQEMRNQTNAMEEQNRLLRQQQPSMMEEIRQIQRNNQNPWR